MIRKKEKFCLALFCIGLVLVCFGCSRKNQQQVQAKFEIDKSYERGPLSVHIRVDKSKLSIAETLLLEIEAVIRAGFDVNMPKIGTQLVDFGIVDWRDFGKSFGDSNNVTRRCQYKLEPFLSGSFELPAFTFDFYDVNRPAENKYQLTTEPVKIEVTSLLGEQKGKLNIADIEGVVEIPKTSSLFWLWIAGAIMVVVGGAAIWWYLAGGKVKEISRIFRPAHEIAYARLKGLVDENLIEAGRIKEFYERISNILRHYIEDRFSLHAPERTTEEFLDELKSAGFLAPADKQRLAEFLNLCDLVKFAKYEPATGQIQKTFDLVKEFIEKTKSDERKVDVTDRIPAGEAVNAGGVK